MTPPRHTESHGVPLTRQEHEDTQTFNERVAQRRRYDDEDGDGASHRQRAITPRTVWGMCLRDAVVVLIFVVGVVATAVVTFTSLRAADAATNTRVEAIEKRAETLVTKGDVRELKQWMRLCLLDPKNCDR